MRFFLNKGKNSYNYVNGEEAISLSSDFINEINIPISFESVENYDLSYDHLYKIVFGFSSKQIQHSSI